MSQRDLDTNRQKEKETNNKDRNRQIEKHTDT